MLLCLSRLAEEERLVPRLLHGVERVRAARTPTKGERGEVGGDEAKVDVEADGAMEIVRRRVGEG